MPEVSLPPKRLTDKGKDVNFYRLGVPNKNNTNRVFDRMKQHLGRLDILVNNAKYDKSRHS